MQFQKSLLTATLLAVGSLSVANAAPITTDSFDVLLKVDSVCAIVTDATQDINLGNVAAGEAQMPAGGVTGTTTITTRCSKGATAKITLQPVSTISTDGTGNLLGGTSNAEKVAYKLTSVSKDGSAWGTATPVTTAAAANYATSIDTIVYATVTSTADVTPGDYKDTVNVSVEF